MARPNNAKNSGPLFVGRPYESVLQIAERFAREYFETPRTVGDWGARDTRCFCLDGGVHWYRVGSVGKVLAIYRATF